MNSEKPLGFDERVDVPVSSDGGGDDIEQVAMLAGGAIRPFAARALASGWTIETQIEAAAFRVAPVTDDPVAAYLSAVRQIMAADFLPALGEAPNNLLGSIQHGAISKLKERAFAGALQSF